MIPNSLMPVLFIPHGGGPCFFMDWDPPETWEEMAAYLKSLGAALPRKPQAIVVVSAHWEEKEFTVTTNSAPDLIYDYYGFPDHTYQIKYPAAGAPDLAGRICGLLEKSGIPVRADAERGFDHGVFIPLKLMFPAADIPIVQLSLKHGLDPAAHMAAGRSLAPLRREDVLIVGSGMSYHNLKRFFRGHDPASDIFDRWLTETVTAETAPRAQRLLVWSDAPAAREAHPRAEHLLPLMVAAGAAEGGDGTVDFHGHVNGIALSGYRFA
ncbi:MAG: dioxygenase [Alphaproteobacteria bacterium]|nr:dioxygenase [Alphaproteobacteria bacterium]